MVNRVQQRIRRIIAQWREKAIPDDAVGVVWPGLDTRRIEDGTPDEANDPRAWLAKTWVDDDGRDAWEQLWKR